MSSLSVMAAAAVASMATTQSIMSPVTAVFIAGSSQNSG
jgi:hypothetical protein